VNLTGDVVIATAVAYVALLFALAFVSDRWARNRQTTWLRSPLVYTLSLSVYCTSWTFYGAVGSAARNGLEFVTIYLGPTLVFVGWWLLLRKIVRIGRVHRITSIADFLSSRYGKSSPVAALVTVIAVLGTTPYIALQLEAVTTSFQVVASGAALAESDTLARAESLRIAFWVAVGLAVFTIAFGTRNLDANEHHPGVVAAIAFEALVKLIALLAVGAVVVFAMGGGVEAVFAEPIADRLVNREGAFGTRWMVLTLLSATAIICLPRQFQVTVVENSHEDHLRTASWLFPTYLLLTCLFTLPIAIVGLSQLPAGTNPDMFVLSLPLAAGHDALALFVFIGGFSSATSMVIVASIALSIMVSNHVVVPLALRWRRVTITAAGDLKELLLLSRRVSIGIILMLGFVYYWLSANLEGLASIGLIAFAGVAQFMPALVAGLYWRNATAPGAISGLTAGMVVWAYTLFVPSFEISGGALSALLETGPGAIEWLRPQALFGQTFDDPLIHALFWSLGTNTLALVGVSFFTQQRPLERLQSALFVDAFRQVAGNESRVIARSASTSDLYELAQRILGREDAHRLFVGWAKRQGRDDEMPVPDAAFIAFLERRLTGTIGAASTRLLVSQVATGETISLDEVIKLVDETQQVIEYSHQLEQKSRELEATATQLREANVRLRALDVEKDDFLSQVSHELRTPMTSIRSFSEILLDTPDLSEERLKHFAEIIHGESQRLTRLLDQILDLSYLERGEMNLTARAVALDEALNGALDTCRGIADAGGVQLRVVSHLSQVQVMADEDRLRQVFINLVSNGIKYNSSDQPWVELSTEITDGAISVTVTDNGPGVAVEDRDRIFEKFSRGWRETGTGRTGTGLGLAISREIVERLGGSIEMDPEVQDGARFVVTLPVALA
jgi:Na+/proline symporter/nitrogen-specific signal transduction histidine kinase